MTQRQNTLALLTLLLEQEGITGFVPEYRFSPTRRWRFDLACPSVKPPVAIEFEGGVFQHGWHSSIERYITDARKYTEAALLGWRVLRFTAADDLPYMVDCVKRALGVNHVA